MKKSELDLLNDLVRVNNDRMAVYQKAACCANEQGFSTALLNVGNNSEPITIVLNNAIANLGGDPAIGTTLIGRLFGLWMGIRAFFGSNDSTSIMTLCCAVDAIAQKAFKNAITETQLSPAVRQMVHDQEEALRASSALAKTFEESPLRGRPFAPHYKLI